MMCRRLLSILLSIVVLYGASTARAQDYPARPIHFIVPNTPGTITDIIARAMAVEMSKSLGQPIVVETKPGADSLLGSEYVARQMPADGYTVLVALGSTAALLPLTSSNLRFDPLKDLSPVIGLAEGRLLFGSPTAVPWKTFNELVAYAKANPGKLNSASAVPSVRMSVEAIIRGAGMNVVHVPYPGYAGLVTALLQGDIHMTLVAEASLAALGDKFRVLAVTGDERLASFPEAPTLKELGFPKVRGVSYSLNVRAGTSSAAIEKLRAAASAALQQPTMKAQLSKLKLDVLNEGPEAAARTIAETAEFYSGVAREIGLRPQ